MCFMKQIDAQQSAYHPAMTGQTAPPYLYDLDGMSQIVGETIKEDLPKARPDNGTDEYILYQQHEMILADIFFFQDPAP